LTNGLRRAAKLGFTRAVVPAACAQDRELQEMRLMSVSQLHELVAWFGLPDME
jgi:predicted ATP-dependent serine protease